MFTLGDNAYQRGTAGQYDHCYGPTWGRHRQRTRPAPGNHEYGTARRAGYFGYFAGRAGTPGRGWYAYNRGAWRIYVLNSNCAEVGGCWVGSRQERWLRGDLASHPQQCVLAYWHHPLQLRLQRRDGSRARVVEDAGGRGRRSRAQRTRPRLRAVRATGLARPAEGAVAFASSWSAPAAEGFGRSNPSAGTARSGTRAAMACCGCGSATASTDGVSWRPAPRTRTTALQAATDVIHHARRVS